MHDPYSLAFSIRLPLVGTLVNVWHKDPGGYSCDDSCGWSFPPLTETQRSQLRGLAFWEGRERVFLCCSEKEWIGSQVQLEHLYRCLLLTVARYLDLPMSFDEAAKEASVRMGIGGCENVGRFFCFVAGYHTNRRENTPKEREDYFYGVVAEIARTLLAKRRRWWRHPRWHVRHWRLKFPFLLRFKRDHGAKSSS